MALIGLIYWSMTSVKNACAESGSDQQGASSMKQEAGAKVKDPVTRHLEALARHLGLLAEQQEAIKTILKDEAIQMDEIRADAKLSVSEK